eukprot:6149064-Prymnesium_polylepis.1
MQSCAARPFALRVLELEQTLVAKQAELDKLTAECEELRERPTTIHYNNSVNNSVNVSVLAYGNEPLPDTKDVRKILLPPE